MKEDIDNIILWLKLGIKSLRVVHYSYETSGKYDQLHWHAIVRVRSYLRYSPYTQYGLAHFCTSYSINWTPITNMKGAIKYIYKDTERKRILQERILLLNYYYHHYMFGEERKGLGFPRIRSLASERSESSVTSQILKTSSFTRNDKHSTS